MKNHINAGAALALVLAASSAARAQSIDYGSLQQLFNEPVTTSATGSPQRSSEAPVPMDIISAEDIKRSGATDLPTILSRVAGLDILQWGAQSADVGVRGYDGPYSPRLLVLINGRQVYLDHYGYTAWASLPVQLDEIRQIEVVKGPNSALFGFNAVSGVVNIITFNPKYDDVNTATVRGGTQSDVEGDLVSTFRIGKRFSARASVGGAQSDEWKNGVGGPDPGAGRPARLSANLDTVTQITDKSELRVEGSWSNSQINEYSPSATYSYTKYVTDSVKATFAADTNFGQAQVSAYRNDAEIKNFLIDFNNHVTVVSGQDLFKIGALNTFRLSAEYRSNGVNTTPFGAGHIDYDVYSAAGMWNWAATSKIAVTVAARFDSLDLSRTGAFALGAPFTNASYDRTIQQPSYNAGVVWRASDTGTLRLSAARGLQIPSLATFGAFTLAFPTPFGFIGLYGNPNEKVTLIDNYEVDYEKSFPTLAAQGRARLFYQTSRDVQAQGPIKLNVGSSDEKGIELEASGALAHGFRWSANYTWTDVDNSGAPGVSLDQTLANYGATTPEHRGNVSLGWADKRWTVDGFVRLVSDYAAYDANSNLRSIAAYATLAGRVARQIDPGLTLALSAENLLQDRQRQTIGLEAPRRVLISLTKAW